MCAPPAILLQFNSSIRQSLMEIRCIAIVGASNLGRKIAYRAALAGFRTILEDISPARLEQGLAWVACALAEDVARGKCDRAAREAALGRLTTAKSAEEASREMDLIIEAVPDEMEMKLELFTIFDKFAKPRAIFASTTASFLISDLASVTACPERCIGMRFFGDAPDEERLELVKGCNTSGETIAACLEAGRRLASTVSILKDRHVLSAGGRD
jgi:3-hydroxybutyryl-CoA dehydrogenase